MYYTIYVVHLHSPTRKVYVLIVVLVLELAEGKKTIRSTLWLRRKLSKRGAVGLIRRVHEGVHPSTEKTKGIDKLR
jgi:hypothetical protein